MLDPLSQPQHAPTSAPEIGRAHRADPVPPAVVLGRSWSAARRVLFRFVLVYFTLYFFPVPEGFVPGSEWLVATWGKLFLRPVPWICRSVLAASCEVPTAAYANGDTASDYAAVLMVLVTAIFVTTLWSIADRHATGYPRLYAVFRAYARFVLAFLMLMYGVIKLYKGQFLFPSLHEMARPLGELSPMGLLWTFMGYSKTYTVFTGALETASAALLYFRRTTLLGASMTALVMTNVVVLNFSYQVPVKLLATHILILAMVVIAPDMGRLVDFFLRNRPTHASIEPQVASGRTAKAAAVVKAFLVGWAVWQSTSMAAAQTREWGDDLPKHPLYGMYTVESFAVNGETIAPLLTDARRWRRLIVDAHGSAVVTKMDDSARPIECDTSQKTCTLTESGGCKGVLTYERPDDEHIVLRGTVGDDSLVVHAQRVDWSAFPLMRAKFRWMHE